jgi:F0F1-type ATP synthase delta subunit
MLPKLIHPTFTTQLLTVKEKISYRPFTVREEKILLMAAESSDERDIAGALVSVLSNCVHNDIDISSIALFDVQYLFLQLRAKSVSDTCHIKIRDLEDHQVREFEIELDRLLPKVVEGHSKIVKLISNPNITLEFRYPTLKDLGINTNIDMINTCLDVVYDSSDDSVYSAKELPLEEKVEFINTLSKQDRIKICDEFVENMPTMEYVIKYMNSNKHHREHILRGLSDFFLLA